MTEAEFERLKIVADLLMATAYADGQLEGVERDKVHDILAVVVLDDDALPRLLQHVERFALEAFDLDGACRALGNQSRGAARMLLSLLAQVADADGEQHLAEGSFVREVAKRIGATAETYADLASEVLSIGPLIAPDES